MRKTLSMLLLAATLPVAAFAGPQSPSGEMPMECHHGDMGAGHGGMGELRLSPEQRKAIGEARRTAMQERREINQRYLDKLSESDKKAMQAELKASTDKAEKVFQDQLTPEQRKSFEEFRKQREERRTEWQEFQKWKADKEAKGQ